MIRALLILTVLSLPVAAQQPRLVDTLPNDQFIIEINGKEYRALNSDKVAELAKQKIDLDKALADLKDKDILIREANLQRDLAQTREALQKQRADSFEQDFVRAREDVERNFNLYVSERDLRIEASQFIPHSSVKGFWGKLLTALDSPYSQAAWKMGVPVVQMFRCK